MDDFKYVVNNTEDEESFFKSVIQANTGNFARQTDVDELKNDIEMFLQEKEKNNQKKILDNIYNYLEKTAKLDVISGNTSDIYDTYILVNKKEKKIIPVFSSKIKEDLHKDSKFFLFKNSKYLNYYMEYRISKILNDKISKISLRDLLENSLNNNLKYDIVLDILELNIILVDKNLNYIKTLQNKENKEFLIIMKNKDKFKNISIQDGNGKHNLLDRKKDKQIISSIQNKNSEENATTYEEKNKLDFILEDIEGDSSYMKEELLSNIDLLD